MSFRSIKIGRKIREARKAANMSQSQLAYRLKKSLRTIQKYECGEILPPLHVIDAIAEILNTTTAHFIGYGNQEICLDTVSDVAAFFYQLNKKENLRFEISVKRSVEDHKWECAVCFDANDAIAEMNPYLCKFLEDFCRVRQDVETHRIDRSSFDFWMENQLIDYGGLKLRDQDVIPTRLSDAEGPVEAWDDFMEVMKKAEELAKKSAKSGERNNNSDK